MASLAGKVAIVTGGGAGIGRGIARGFSAFGARVAILELLPERARAVAAEIQAAGGTALALPTDVRDGQAVESAVAATCERFGGVDVLVNNAGIDLAKRFELTTLEDWERVVAINQTGVFLGMRTVARAMIAANRGGSIINISSVAGMEGVKGRAAYGSTKWAVRGMTKTGAIEWGDRGIRVNSIHPGIIETPMTAGLRAFTDADVRARTERTIPLGRVGQPIDIAYMALFLASDESAYCSGQEFVVDGGIHH
jgi:3alpha(or 20beta)-hydroxysteroid dehydrogenase